jgi:uridine phosphorylase
MLPQFGETPHCSSPAIPTFAAPKIVILCFQNPFLKQMLKETPHKQCDGCFSKLFFLEDFPEVAVGSFGGGAPIVAANVEKLIAWGVEQFISIGTAGSLQEKAKIGDLVICEKAIRDEGTSHHYLPPTKYIHAPRRMTNKLQHHLKKAELPYLIGSSWTTDRLYHQTMDEIDHYQKEGIITVEREAAALFAVAHFYRVDLGAMFTINDSHTNLTWQPDTDDKRTAEGLHALMTAALALSKEQ